MRGLPPRRQMQAPAEAQGTLRSSRTRRATLRTSTPHSHFRRSHHSNSTNSSSNIISNLRWSCRRGTHGERVDQQRGEALEGSIRDVMMMTMPLPFVSWIRFLLPCTHDPTIAGVFPLRIHCLASRAAPITPTSASQSLRPLIYDIQNIPTVSYETGAWKSNFVCTSSLPSSSSPSSLPCPCFATTQCACNVYSQDSLLPLGLGQFPLR